MPDDVKNQLSGASGPMAGDPNSAVLNTQAAPGPDPTTASPPTDPQNPAGAIPGMEQNIQGLQEQQSGIVEAELGQTQQVEKELQGLKTPQRNTTKAMDAAPLLIGLMALGGKAMKLHGSVMLGALNGAVGGMLKGNQQAFDDNMKKYLDAKQKILETYDLQQHYFDTVYKSMGDKIKNQQQAIQVARDLTNDQWNKDFKQQQLANTQQMDQTKAWYMQQSITERLRALDEKTMFDGMRMEIDKMKAQTQANDVNSKITQRQQIIQQKLTAKDTSTKDIDGMITDVSKQMASLKKKYSDIETMSPEDKQAYDGLLNEMGQLEVGRKLITPVPVSDPSEVDGLDPGQRYLTPDGAIRVKGGGQGGAPGGGGGNTTAGAPGGAGGPGAPGAGGNSAGSQPPAPGVGP
jgi:hypothetical protein